MLFGNITELQQLGLPQFDACLEFMKEAMIHPPVNDVPIPLKYGCTAYPQAYEPRAFAEVPFEAHKKYYDIQFLLSGHEKINVAATSGLTSHSDYDVSRDIQFFDLPQNAMQQLVLHRGDYLIVSPRDAHQPGVQDDELEAVTKLVIKVPVTNGGQ